MNQGKWSFLYNVAQKCYLQCGKYEAEIKIDPVNSILDLMRPMKWKEKRKTGTLAIAIWPVIVIESVWQKFDVRPI